MIDDTRLKELARRAERGVISTRQAVDLGFARDQRCRLIDGVRWERVTPRVARLVGAPETAHQRVVAAVLDAGTGAALQGSSAAAWWGIPGNALEPIRVVRTRDRSTTSSQVVQRREPTIHPPHHVVTLDGVATQVPARALFDIAGTKRRGAEKPWWVERMARMVDNAWAARLVSGRTLHRMLTELSQRGRPGIRVMRQVLTDRGTDYVPPASNLEARAIKILADADLPPMRRQVDLGDDESWIGRVDLCDEVLPLVIEIQSERFHSSLIDQQLDSNRIARLEAAGMTVVELTDEQVWHRPAEVVAAVRQAREHLLAPLDP